MRRVLAVLCVAAVVVVSTGCYARGLLGRYETPEEKVEVQAEEVEIGCGEEAAE